VTSYQETTVPSSEIAQLFGGGAVIPQGRPLLLRQHHTLSLQVVPVLAVEHIVGRLREFLLAIIRHSLGSITFCDDFVDLVAGLPCEDTDDLDSSLCGGSVPTGHESVSNGERQRIAKSCRLRQEGR